MNKFLFPAAGVTAFFVLMAFIYNSSNPQDVEHSNPTPVIFKNDKHALLQKITQSLEEYKNANLAYPKSNRREKGFDYLFLKGVVDTTWISNFASDVLTESEAQNLQRNGKIQFAYMSDGANYKLIVVHDKDCEIIIVEHPELRHSGRASEPCSYGTWSAGGARWATK